MDDPWKTQLEALGGFIRAQRQVADLSLRQLGDLTSISNAYLSQVERGLHQPSVRVLKAIAGALDVSPETLLAQAGLLDERGAPETVATAPTATGAAAGEGWVSTVDVAVLADPHLTSADKEALLAVYRGFLRGRNGDEPLAE